MYDPGDQFFRKAIDRLTEREKELNCIYSVEGILKDEVAPLETIFNKILEVIPAGFQYTTICEGRITLDGKIYQSEDFRETEWKLQAEIIVDSNIAGIVEVAYTQLIKITDNNQFLPQEQRLLNNIADRIGDYLFYRRVKKSLSVLKSVTHEDSEEDSEVILSPESDQHWKWRFHMVEMIASKLDPERFGVSAFYLIGSTKNATSGPGSDIDIMVHFTGSPQQRCQLVAWMEGWGQCLAEMNFEKTGYHTKNLIDLHIITDEDIKQKSSFASKIGAIDDGARQFPLKSNFPQ